MSLMSYFYRALAKRKLMNLDQGLLTAAWNGNAGKVKTLLAAGADVHVLDDRVLWRAVASGDAATVEAVLKAGADVHQNHDAEVWLAEKNGRHDLVGILKDSVAREVTQPRASQVIGAGSHKTLPNH